jgi:uncharacterized cupredoxin-like copper-binding protein
VSRKPFAVLLALLFVTLVAACGGGDNVNHAASGGRTIDIDMKDNDFSPASISVKAGEQVQFVFHNKGRVPHDAFVGDEAAQMAHEHDMMASSAMDHPDHGGEGITVEPGQTGTLSHAFDKSGTSVIGCHQPGHYAAGMRINVNVT